MQQDVYVDLYFLINTSMNLLCLMITASLLHRRVNRTRAILAAALGGLYAAAALLLGAGGILGVLADAAVGMLMCVVTFAARGTSLWQLIKCGGVQILTSVLLGGVMTALYAGLNRLELPLEVLQGDGLSVWMFALLSAVAGFATVRGGRFLGFSKRTKSVTVRAHVAGASLSLRAMVDSGNLLRDPVSGKSVIVADRSVVLKVLPQALSRSLEGNDVAKWLHDPAYARLIRLIPTSTATKSALLPALVPQSLQICDGKSTYAADYLIAVADLGERAGGFDAVIPAE